MHFRICLLIIISLPVCASVISPPLPELGGKKIDYLHWYKEVIRAESPGYDGCVLFLHFRDDEDELSGSYSERLWPYYGLLRGFIEKILTESPIWDSAEHPEIEAILDDVMATTAPIKPACKFSVCFDQDNVLQDVKVEHLNEFLLPYLGRDRILIWSFLCAALKDTFDEDAFIRHVKDISKVLEYGQCGNHGRLLLEIRFFVTMKALVYDLIYVLDTNEMLSDRGKRELYGLLEEYDDLGAADLMTAGHFERAAEYEKLQDMSRKTFFRRRVILDRGNVKKCLDRLDCNDLNSDSLALLLKESPEDILKRLNQYYDAVYDYLQKDERVDHGKHFVYLRERYLSGLSYFDYFRPVCFQQIYEQVIELEDKRNNLLLLLWDN